MAKKKKRSIKIFECAENGAAFLSFSVFVWFLCDAQELNYWKVAGDETMKIEYRFGTEHNFFYFIFLLFFII